MKILLVLTVAVLVLAGCVTPDPGPVPSTPAPGSTDTLPNTTVITSQTIEPIGAILVDGTNRPLYVYVPDKDSETSTCTSLCPDVYTPVLADDAVVAQGGVDEGLIGVGGDGQVLYNGHLLYTYTLDVGSSTPSGVTPEFLLITPTGSVKAIV